MRELRHLTVCAIVALLALACDDESGPSPSPSATPANISGIWMGRVVVAPEGSEQFCWELERSGDELNGRIWFGDLDPTGLRATVSGASVDLSWGSPNADIGSSFITAGGSFKGEVKGRNASGRANAATIGGETGWEATLSSKDAC